MERAPARAMLRAVGMGEGDSGRSQVGIASSWNEVTPCNLPLAAWPKRPRRGCGPRASRWSYHHRRVRRHLDGDGGCGVPVVAEIIADSVECVMHGERFDGIVTLAGCDRACPGC